MYPKDLIASNTSVDLIKPPFRYTYKSFWNKLHAILPPPRRHGKMRLITRHKLTNVRPSQKAGIFSTDSNFCFSTWVMTRHKKLYWSRAEFAPNCASHIDPKRTVMMITFTYQLPTFYPRESADTVLPTQHDSFKLKLAATHIKTLCTLRWFKREPSYTLHINSPIKVTPD